MIRSPTGKRAPESLSLFVPRALIGWGERRRISTRDQYNDLHGRASGRPSRGRRMCRDMRTIYLLPCDCGREIPIESRQAGETVRCECGRTCAVPTMREVQNLRPAPVSGAAPMAARPAWGNSQRLLVAGLVVLLLAAIAAAILHGQFSDQFGRLRPPEAERQFVEGLSTLKTIQYFQQWILPGIDIHEQAGFQIKNSTVYLGMEVLTGLGTIGLILAAIGVVGIVRRR